MPVSVALVDYEVTFGFFVTAIELDGQFVERVDLVVIGPREPFPIDGRTRADDAGETLLDSQPPVPCGNWCIHILLKVEVEDLLAFFEIVNNNVAVALNRDQVITQRYDVMRLRDGDGSTVFRRLNTDERRMRLLLFSFLFFKVEGV